MRGAEEIGVTPGRVSGNVITGLEVGNPAARGEASTTADAVLYLDDAHDSVAALLPVAGRPLVFRALMAAVRAGFRRVAVPAALRSPALEAAIARTSAARAATVWIGEGGEPPADPVLLLPATVVVPPTVLGALRRRPPPAVLAESRTEAPIVTADAAFVKPFWPALAAGKPIGDAWTAFSALARLPMTETGWGRGGAAGCGQDSGRGLDVPPGYVLCSG
jgi:hypothetical protein